MSENAKHLKKQPQSSWQWVSLRNVADVISGQHILESDYNQNEQGIGYLTGPADFGRIKAEISKWTEKPKVTCQPMDVLVTVKGAGVGKINLAPDVPVAIGRQLMAVRGYHKIINPVFLYLYLMTLLYHFQKSAMGATVPGLSRGDLESLKIPLPPLADQHRIATLVGEQMTVVEKSRLAAEARLEAAMALPAAFATDSLNHGQTRRIPLSECLIEVKNGVGSDWEKYPVLGATRQGIAPAKETVGKTPERYKVVDPVTVFYNPMRILLGSIAMVDEGDETGITSPDYVVVKGKLGILDTRWFYYWFRSAQGAHLIDSLTRGAVRERILFNRLAAGEIELPDWEVQLCASERMMQIRPIVESISNELETINALPAALLRRAFSGEV